jgi:hypothetical protein
MSAMYPGYSIETVMERRPDSATRPAPEILHLRGS